MGDVYRNILNNIKTMNEIDIQRQTVASNDFVLAESLRKQNMQRELSDLLTTKPESSLSDLIPTVIKYSPLEGMKMKQDVSDAEAKRQLEQVTIQQKKQELGSKAKTEIMTQLKGVVENNFTADPKSPGYKALGESLVSAKSTLMGLGLDLTPEQIDEELKLVIRSSKNPEAQLYMKGLEKQQSEAIENQARANQALTPKEKIDLGLQQQKINMDAQKFNIEQQQKASGIGGDKQPVILVDPKGVKHVTSFDSKVGYVLPDGTVSLVLPENWERINATDAALSSDVSSYLGIATTKMEAQTLAKNVNMLQTKADETQQKVSANLSKLSMLLDKGDQKGFVQQLSQSQVLFNIARAANGAGVLTQKDFEYSTIGGSLPGALADYERYITGSYSKATTEELKKFAEITKVISHKIYQKQQLNSIDAVLANSAVPRGTDKYNMLRNQMFKQITGRDIPSGVDKSANVGTKSGAKIKRVIAIPDQGSPKPVIFTNPMLGIEAPK